jgi:transcriptional regulator with XRE-family HTH domain
VSGEEACASSLVAAANCRRLRKERGWRQDDLAGRTGLRQSTVSMTERGQRNFALRSLELIAAAYGVQVWELLKPPGDPG